MGKWSNYKRSRHYLDNKNESRKQKDRRVKDSIREHKITLGCFICGYNKHYSALEFHHTDPNKDKDVTRMSKSNSGKIWDEIGKCVVLCANCHREAHAGLNGVGLPERDTLMPKDVYEYGLSVIRNREQMELFGREDEGLNNFKLAARDVIIRKEITEEQWTEMYSPEFWERIKHYPAEGPIPGQASTTVN